MFVNIYVGIVQNYIFCNEVSFAFVRCGLVLVNRSYNVGGN